MGGLNSPSLHTTCPRLNHTSRPPAFHTHDHGLLVACSRFLGLRIPWASPVKSKLLVRRLRLPCGCARSTSPLTAWPRSALRRPASENRRSCTTTPSQWRRGTSWHQLPRGWAGSVAMTHDAWMADAVRLDSIFRFDWGRSDSTDPIRPACKAPGAQLMEVSRNSVLPDAFSRLRKMYLDERWSLKAAPRRSMLPDAFSRLRKMHLDNPWVLEAAPRRSMLPDAFSRLRKMHLDERWIRFSRQLLEGACFQMRFPGSENCI